MLRFILLFISIYDITVYAVTKEYVEASIKRAADKVGVPPELLSAICWAESRHEPEAYAHGDGKNQNHAFGICQVLYTTALDLGLPKDDNCKRDFRTKQSRINAGETPEKDFIPIKRDYHSCALFGPYSNALYAAKFLRWKLDTYDESWISATAAYNSGTVRTCPEKGYFNLRTYKKGIVKYKKILCTPGGLLNQQYVDRVMKALKERR